MKLPFVRVNISLETWFVSVIPVRLYIIDRTEVWCLKKILVMLVNIYTVTHLLNSSSVVYIPKISFTNQSNAAVLKWKKPEVYPAQAIPFLTSETFLHRCRTTSFIKFFHTCVNMIIFLCVYTCVTWKFHACRIYVWERWVGRPSGRPQTCQHDWQS